jgi:MFS family permease
MARPEPVFGRGYRRYVLATLTLVYTLNCLDQGLIILLLQPIKEDLHLSDTELGFLTGIAFGLFYATVGVPIARWADRADRASIASMAIGLWGVTVMLCLFVTSFIQLAFARVAAGIGESGGMPPTYSLVGDYFPRAAERARAMAIYMLASPVSLLVSFIVGGWVNERYGWRMTFFVMGVPGLLVGALVKLTVRDPRSNPSNAPDLRRAVPSLRDIVGILWHRASSRHLTIAFILLYTMGLGLSPWYAAFMIRNHGMGTAELGVWLGVIFGLSGVAGTLLGGYVTARWFGGDERAQMRLSAIVVSLLVPCFVLFLLLPSKGQALAALTPTIILGNFISGPAFALIQRLVSDDIRATTLAIVMLFANLIGMGVGPQAVGILSDWLLPRVGEDSLRYAMLAMSSVALWSAYHFWQVGRTVREDLQVNETRHT